jgi:ABC-type sugar transport system permease subunit
MIKRLLIVFVAFVTLFLTQSQVWAAATDTSKSDEVIVVDKTAFFNQDSPAMIAKKMGSGGMDNSILWIASIFIAGLGQILMGDMWRGLRFTLIVYGIPIILGIIGGVIAAGAVANPGGAAGLLGIWSLVGIVGWIVSVVFYVLNIIDAYNMSKEESGMSKLNSEELAKLQQDIQKATEIANSIKVSSNGTVSVKALAF